MKKMSGSLKVQSQIQQQYSIRLKRMYRFPASVNEALVHKKAHSNGYKSARSFAHKDGIITKEVTPMCPCCKNFVNTISIPMPYSTYPKSFYDDDFVAKKIFGMIIKQQYNTANVFQMQTGDALFFCFVKLIITFLVLRFLILDAYNLLTNSLGHYCSQIHSAKIANICVNSLISMTSTANKSTALDQSYFQIYDILNLVFTIFSIIFFVYGRKKLFQLYWLLQMYNISEDDYTLLIEDIPPIPFERSDTMIKDLNKDYKGFLKRILQTKIRNWLNNFYSYDGQTQIKEYLDEDFYKQIYTPNVHNTANLFDNIVTSVNLCYDLTELQHLQNIRQELVHSFIEEEGNRNAFENSLFDDQVNQTARDNQKNLKLTKLLSQNYKDVNNNNKNEMLHRYISHIPHQIEIINKHYMKVCQKISQVKSVQQQNQSNATSRIRNVLQSMAFDTKEEDDVNFLKISRFVGKAFVSFRYQHFKYYLLNQYQKNNDYLKTNGNKVRLRLSAAQKPNDVYWHSMKISDSFRFKQIKFSYLLVIIGLFISFIIIYGLRVLQSTFVSKSDEKSIFQTMYLLSLPLWTFLVNYALDWGLQLLNKSERHKTKTQQLSSLIVKNVGAKFINTSVIYAFIYFFGSQINPLAQDGLVSILFSLVIVNVLLNITMEFIQPKLKYQQWKASKYTKPDPKDGKFKPVNIFQIQLNKALQKPRFEYAHIYSYYLQMIYICSFYGYLMPLITPIVIIALALQYWIDKFNLLKRFSSPIDMGYFLTDLIWICFEMSIILTIIGHFIWGSSSHSKYSTVSIICNYASLVLVIVYSCTILFWYKKIAIIYQNNISQQPYEKAMQKFTSTYESENPATALTDTLDNKSAYLNDVLIKTVGVYLKRQLLGEKTQKKFVSEKQQDLEQILNNKQDTTVKSDMAYHRIKSDFKTVGCC